MRVMSSLGPVEKFRPVSRTVELFVPVCVKPTAVLQSLKISHRNTVSGPFAVSELR